MTTIRRRCRYGFSAKIAGAVLAGSTLMASSAAQEGGRLMVDVSECIELVTPEDRLACFEAQVERSRQGGVPQRATEPAAASSDGEARGTSPPADATAVRQRVRRERADPDVPLVVATVTALRETVPNSYVITFDNGQVWRQLNPMRYPLRVGMEVQVYPPSWGEVLRLKATDVRGYMPVERVR